MKTRLLMGLSAAFYATLGVGATFLPQELVARFGGRPEGYSVLVIQMLGALYLGFAMLNWMNRGNRIGGIYGRPVSLANFFNFAVAAVALLKASFAPQLAIDVVTMAAIYTVFAVWFGMVLFTSPADIA